MVKAKPNQKIHVDKLQTALDKLEQLESKPVEELTLRDSIYFMRDKLNSALKKGYNYQDLSSILEDQGILVSAATLKQYLTDIKKQSSRRKKSNSSSRANKKTLKNVTSSSSESALNKKDTASNSNLEVESTKQAVKLNSSSSSKLSLDSSQKVSQKDRQLRSKKSTLTESKVLSGSNDDLSSDFNRY